MTSFDKGIHEQSLSDLNRLYFEGMECDKQIAAEMRTNLQLVAGNHYVREGTKFWNRIQNNKTLSSEQKLKLTKNHMQRATKTYRNMIESISPDVQCFANNEKELKDQKAAQMHESYWSYIKECNDFPTLRAVWCKNFVELGEVAVKVFFDMNGGQVVGYEAEPMLNPDNTPMVHPETNEVQIQRDQFGNPVVSDRPVYGGKVKLETIEPYNIKRDPNVSSMSESPYLIIEKLIAKSKLRTFLSEEQAKKLDSSAPLSSYTVFDNNTGTYKQSAEQVLVKEIYFRPCPKAPNGYFYIYTDQFILEKGELPYGIFPIVWQGFDEQTGNPRCHSIIRHGRPSQMEINRCISKIAEHHVTLGDDKVFIQSNAKLTQGAILPGIRVSSYTGAVPTVVPGRSGEQYFKHLENEIMDFYRLMNVEEIQVEKQDSPDIYANLLRSYRFRRKFMIYGEKFERFLGAVCKTALQIAKKSINDEELVQAVGRSEYLNIPEFKNSEDIHYQIKIRPKSDDVESQFGKQIAINQVLQYVGGQLDREDIGKMLRNAPFLNTEQMFDDFTQKYDTITNDMVAMDRGTWRPPRKYDDHDYVIRMLTSRMSKSDFDQLNPQIQMMYEQKLSIHEQIKAEQVIALQRAQAGLIPSGGFLVVCDFYVPDPADKTKTKRLKVPSEALSWLVDQLASQGTVLADLETQSKGVLTDIGRMIEQNTVLQNLGEPNAKIAA